MFYAHLPFSPFVDLKYQIHHKPLRFMTSPQVTLIHLIMCSVSQEGSTTAFPQGNRTETLSLLKGGKLNTHELFLKTAVTQHLCPTQNQYLQGYFWLLFRKEASYLFSHQFLNSPLVCKLLLLHPTAPSFPSQLMKVQFWQSQGYFLPLFFQPKHVLPAAASCTPAHKLRSWVIRMSCISSD